MSTRDEERKKKEKKQKDWLEAYIISILQKSLEAAMGEAMEDIFASWK